MKAIPLPASDGQPAKDGPSLTPAEIVRQLDRYIVGQDKAKKAVAIALRNRWRRSKVEGDIREEILPNNIILIGPTGVGKTEIARRLARLAQAPFVKVEASKFTEVGYVGRDVDSMVRDLMEIGVGIVKAERTEKVMSRAEELAEERLLDILLPRPRAKDEDKDRTRASREKLREKLLAGELDKRIVEVSATSQHTPLSDMLSHLGGGDEMTLELQDMIGANVPKKTRRRKLSVGEARRVLVQEEAQKLVDMDDVIAEARRRTEEHGIIFIDEIDKIVAVDSPGQSTDVSRGGVQRDLLPVVEGSSVLTKYGMVRTDHVLFIAAGAFHKVKPADMIPELQGRFPIRVTLQSLAGAEFKRILTEPENSLLRQYSALVATEDVELEFEDAAVDEIAAIAASVNEQTENIGARRLHTVMTALLEDILFRLPDTETDHITITADLVKDKLKDIAESKDLSRYML